MLLTGPVKKYKANAPNGASSRGNVRLLVRSGVQCKDWPLSNTQDGSHRAHMWEYARSL